MCQCLWWARQRLQQVCESRDVHSSHCVYSTIAPVPGRKSQAVIPHYILPIGPRLTVYHAYACVYMYGYWEYS